MSRKRKLRTTNETPEQLARRLAAERITSSNAADRKQLVQADGPAAWVKQLERQTAKTRAEM